MKEIKIIDILKKDLICVLFASFAVSTWIVFLIVIVAIIFWGKCPIPETNFYITTRDIPFVIFMIFSANLLSFLIILFKFKYYKTILIRSIPVKGNINSVSKLDEYGMIDINLSYEFHGKLYKGTSKNFFL